MGEEKSRSRISPEFAIGTDESIDAAFRRIAGEQFARIVGELTLFSAAPDESAHNARRRIKETRALLRLFRDELGDRYAPANRLLRDVARELAGVRDADAMRKTLAAQRGRIVGAEGRLVAESARRALRRAITKREPSLLTPPEIAARIDELQLALAELLTATIPSSFDAIEPGLRRSYRAGRTALREASASRSAEVFHEWRKSVKTLWYQMLLLREFAPELTAPYRDLLNKLAKILGEHHDIHVLTTTIAARPTARISAATRVLEQRTRELEADAVALARQIYAERAGAFASRMRALWDAQRSAGANEEEQ